LLDVQSVEGQQAVSTIDPSRVAQQQAIVARHRIDSNGTALPEEETSSDDGFGEQVILQSQPRNPTVFVTGDTSLSYTNNAALTRNHRIDDTIFMANAAIGWTPILTPRLGGEITARSSIFRYGSTSVLDFQSVGLGTGLSWNPEHFAGIGLFAHYDFIEMFDRHSDEILRDHEFTVGAQKGFALGRAQALLTGISLSAGVAEPISAQRDQASLFLDYRIQLSRSLGAEFLYRCTGYFYNDPGHTDANQAFSASLHYRAFRDVYVNGFVSFSDNRSDDAAFDYDAVTSGGGLSLSLSF
jgi:hypothetical protein